MTAKLIGALRPVVVVEVERITVSGTGSTPPPSVTRRTGTGGAGAGATGEESRSRAAGDPGVPAGGGQMTATAPTTRGPGAGTRPGTRVDLTAVSGQKVGTVVIVVSMEESRNLG